MFCNRVIPHSAFKSIQLVRRFHANAFSETPATQTDMVLTQWAFFGLLVTRAHQLGLTYTKEEEEGLVHFWRAVGYLMGIEDRLVGYSGHFFSPLLRFFILCHNYILVSLPLFSCFFILYNGFFFVCFILLYIFSSFSKFNTLILHKFILCFIFILESFP